MPIDLEIVFFISSICASQFNLLSKEFGINVSVYCIIDDIHFKVCDVFYSSSMKHHIMCFINIIC